MTNERFISSNEFAPFDLSDYKYEETILMLNRAWYYEWNSKDQKWVKLNQNDPEPPTLKPGRFDGQIVEILRDKTK